MNEYLGFLLSMSVACLASWLLAVLYAKFTENRIFAGTDIQLIFPLLAISLTSIFSALQFSIPLSLGLLGSLSIIRFRAPIKNPLDIGFIMLVIAISLLASVKNVVALLVVLGLVALFLVLLRMKGRGYIGASGKRSNGTLSLCFEREEFRRAEKSVLQLFGAADPRFRVKNVCENGSQAFVDVLFNDVMPEELTSLRTSLPAGASMNIYFEGAE